MRSAHRFGLAVLVAALGAVAAPARPAFAIPPTSPDCKPVQNHRLITETPWPVRRYQPDRIWPLSTGAGVTVAVIDSGVDATHPQLTGRVAAGKDFLDNRPSAGFDCVGHGTGVASVIGAAPREGVGFVGLAPGVRILPVRVSERSDVTADGGAQGASVDSGGLAQAIRFAVDQHARVINMSIYQFVDDQRVRDAIDYARGHDVVVVAASGNSHDTTAGAVDPTPYPAAYDGVVGVGAIDQSGVRSASSPVGPYVDLVAPGSDITMAANKSGDYWVGEGTSFAAPYVAATAALIRSRWPAMTADDVVRQLEGTADAVPGGPHSGAYGYGEVDPFRAVNEVISKARPAQAPPLGRPLRDVAAERAAAGRARALRLAGWFAAGVAVVIGLVLLLAWVLPRGRRRHWRAGETPISVPPAPVDDSGMYSWSLGPLPAIPNPDRAVDEELIRIVRERRR
jgi:type VII secretion-associated serine protease mycosin